MFFIHGMIKFIFFAQYYNKKLFPILGKKQKQKIFTKPIKKNYKHGCYSVIEMFLKMRKFKKKNVMITVEIKICQTQIQKKKNI